MNSKKRTKAKWFKRPEFLIVGILLLLPIGAAVYYFKPQYYQFSALGEIVSVQEIGVEGSVHFTYVNEGLTRNLYEKISVERQIPDAVFEPADSSVTDEYTEMKEIGEELRNETIRNAVLSAETEAGSDDPASEEDVIEDRLQALIEETATYYGNSIGLMLAIGLAEETQHRDFSRNGKYIIAGTGTLEEDYTVGSVGSIRDKLRTAERDGADYFFVPKDKENYLYEGPSNEEEAGQVADELHLRLRVVPVATLDDALDFLENLDNG